MRPHDPGDRAERAEQRYAEFLARRAGGEELEFDAWARADAELEAELRQIHAGWSGFEEEVRRAADGLFHKAADPAVALPAPQREYRAGERVGEFRLVRLLGRGGMGQVWEAEQESLHRRVALKLLSHTIGASERLLTRFSREAEAGARLNHPHIVAVHTFGDVDGVPYLAQELVEGGSTLADGLAGVGAMDALPADYFRRAAELVLKVARALQVAHASGVVHRDVKPQNILLTAEDEPKIADFGLAQIEDASALSHSGELVGTYCYMSPEQLGGRRSLDHRTDVFSLGATLYEVLTGARAFDGGSSVEVSRKVLHEDPPDARTLRPAVPPELSAICAKALEKVPADRYPSMAAFADDLERYLRHQPVSAARSGLLARALKWARRHPAACTISAILLASGIGITSLWLLNTSAARHNHYLQAELALKDGDVDRARVEVDRAHELYGASAEGYLILARGYSQFSRYAEAAECFERAEALGFRPDAEPETAEEHSLVGLYLMSKQLESGYPEAEAHLARALELDPEYLEASYALYKVRKNLGDLPGAKAALEAYKRQVPEGNDFYTVVEAQLLELDGSFEEAAGILEALCARPDIDDARERQLRVHRSLGQYYLELGERDRAQEELERAVEEFSTDSWSIDNLALLHLRNAAACRDDPCFQEELAQAERRAEQALAVNPYLFNSPRILGVCGVQRIERALERGDVPDEEAFASAREGIWTLRELRPEESLVDMLEAQLAFLEGNAHAAAGGTDRAVDSWKECLELLPGHVPARVRVAQVRWGADRFEDILDDLERALLAWEAYEQDSSETPWLRPVWGRQWWQAAEVWTYGAAAQLGLEERGYRAFDALQGEIDAGRDFSPDELLTFAEFLATSPTEGLRDCEYARSLIEMFELRTAFVGRESADQAAQILAAIDAECP